MTRTAADEAVDHYLDRLDEALAGVPGSRRVELAHEIAEHIADARRELPARDDEAAVRELLDRLGTPEEIAAAELGPGDRPAPASAAGGGDGREKLAIVLLLVGGFFAGIGWLAGVVLLWLSPRWRDRDKLIGTLLIPGGLTTAFVVVALALGTTADPACALNIAEPDCGDSSSVLPGLLLAAVVTLLPLASAAHLLRALRRAR